MTPAVFISHGSPMVAIEKGPYQDALALYGREHRPAAVVVISAHWDSGNALRVNAAAKHHLIYDFGGFPKPLYEVQYPATGDPALAAHVAALLSGGGFSPVTETTRGLDHGVWVPLHLMYPAADVPVVEVSLPGAWSPEELFRLGALLTPLREQGTMILGSGGIVHNLGRLNWGAQPGDAETWAKGFDDWFASGIKARDTEALFRYAELQPAARWAAPTTEHLHPVFTVLGAAGTSGEVKTIYEGFEFGTLSMRSFAIG